jgi:hypothetical protein
MANEFPTLESEIEIAEGEFKRLGDCTRDDLDGAGRVAGEYAALNIRLVELSAAISTGMAARGLESVSMDPALGARLDTDAIQTLCELRKLVADFEAAALAMFDDTPEEGTS